MQDLRVIHLPIGQIRLSTQAAIHVYEILHKCIKGALAEYSVGPEKGQILSVTFSRESIHSIMKSYFPELTNVVADGSRGKLVEVKRFDPNWEFGRRMHAIRQYWEKFMEQTFVARFVAQSILRNGRIMFLLNYMPDLVKLAYQKCTKAFDKKGFLATPEELLMFTWGGIAFGHGYFYRIRREMTDLSRSLISQAKDIALIEAWLANSDGDENMRLLEKVLNKCAAVVETHIRISGTENNDPAEIDPSPPVVSPFVHAMLGWRDPMGMDLLKAVMEELASRNMLTRTLERPHRFLGGQSPREYARSHNMTEVLLLMRGASAFDFFGLQYRITHSDVRLSKPEVAETTQGAPVAKQAMDSRHLKTSSKQLHQEPDMRHRDKRARAASSLEDIDYGIPAAVSVPEVEPSAGAGTGAKQEDKPVDLRGLFKILEDDRMSWGRSGDMRPRKDYPGYVGKFLGARERPSKVKASLGGLSSKRRCGM